MRPCLHPVVDLLPHRPPMVLLDRIEGWEDRRLAAVVGIRGDSPFFQPDRGVPAYIGIEYMAQSCAAYAGLEAVNAGCPVRIGYLLGTRRYLCKVLWFAPGQQLKVEISELFRDRVIGVFDCRIICEGREMAAAQLTVYQPEAALGMPSSR